MNTDKTALPLNELDEWMLDTPDKPASSRFSGPKRFFRWLQGLNRLFLLIVVLPTVTAGIYYEFIASPVFVSNSSFSVQSVQDQEGVRGALGSLLKASSSDDDTANVQEFLQSHDALRQLETDADIRGSYGSAKVDLFSRFGGTHPWDKSFESLYRYYSKRIVTVKPSLVASSIVEVEVRAFTPDEAFLINQRLLDMGEKLVNSLNDRLQQDLVRFAQAEVDTAEKNAEATYVALADYRNSHSIVDTTQQSSLQLTLIQSLQQKLIETRNQLAELTRSSVNNPQIPALRNQIESLESEVATEMAKTSGSPNSLSSKASQYEKLTFERDFREKELTDALTFLETSRNEAQRKELYLKRVVEPNLPDYAMEPRRGRNVVGVLVLSFLLWGIISLFSASVKEHLQ